MVQLSIQYNVYILLKSINILKNCVLNIYLFIFIQTYIFIIKIILTSLSQELVMNIKHSHKLHKINTDIQNRQMQYHLPSHQQHNNINLPNNFHSISLSSEILEHINNYTKRKQSSILSNSTNQKSKKEKGDNFEQHSLRQLFRYSKENKNLNSNYNTNHNSQILVKQWNEHQIQRVQQIIQEIQWLQSLYPNLSNKWSAIVLCEVTIHKLESDLNEFKPSFEKIQVQLHEANNNLLKICKDMISKNREAEYSSTDQINNLLFQAEHSHQILRRKLQHKDFQEIIMFNIKVILPTIQKRERSQITNEQKSQKSIYQQIFDCKAAKKLSLIVKKNNLNGADVKAVNEHMKKIVQIENHYHKVSYTNKNFFQNLKNQQMEQIIQNIEELSFLHLSMLEKKQKLEKKIHDSKHVLQKYEIERQNYLNELNSTVSQQYLKCSQSNTRVDFRYLLRNQINSRYTQYKQLVLEKQRIFMNAKGYNPDDLIEGNDATFF